jgi:hypothetical protein
MCRDVWTELQPGRKGIWPYIAAQLHDRWIKMSTRSLCLKTKLSVFKNSKYLMKGMEGLINQEGFYTGRELPVRSATWEFLLRAATAWARSSA